MFCILLALLLSFSFLLQINTCNQLHTNSCPTSSSRKHLLISHQYTRLLLSSLSSLTTSTLNMLSREKDGRDYERYSPYVEFHKYARRAMPARYVAHDMGLIAARKASGDHSAVGPLPQANPNPTILKHLKEQFPSAFASSTRARRPAVSAVSAAAGPQPKPRKARQAAASAPTAPPAATSRPKREAKPSKRKREADEDDDEDDEIAAPAPAAAKFPQVPPLPAKKGNKRINKRAKKAASSSVAAVAAPPPAPAPSSAPVAPSSAATTATASRRPPAVGYSNQEIAWLAQLRDAGLSWEQLAVFLNAAMGLERTPGALQAKYSRSVAGLVKGGLPVWMSENGPHGRCPR